MPDLSQLLNAPSRSTGAAGGMNVLRGIIRRAPGSATDSLEAASQGYTAESAYEIPASNWARLGPLPTLNETCLVAIDDMGDAYLVLYAGADASSDGGGGGTGTGGGVYSTTIGDGSATSFAVSHSLGTRNLLTGVYRTAAPYDEIVCDVEHSSTNIVTVRTLSAPSPNEYTVVVMAGGGTSGGGTGAGDKNYVHTQGSPSGMWVVTHSLGKFPSVDVVDTGGSAIIPSVLYGDVDTVTLIFGSPTSGKAYLN